MCWKKFLLLPVILFASKVKRDIVERVRLLKDNSWDSFTLGFLTKKGDQLVTGAAPNALADGLQHVMLPDTVEDGIDWQCNPHFMRAKKLISLGEMSKAFKCVIQQAPSVPASTQVLQQLKDKHPLRRLHAVTPAELLELQSFECIQADLLTVYSKDVRKVIHAAHRMIAPGIDMLRYEHLVSLIGRKPEPDVEEAEFSELLTGLVNLMLQGKVPIEVLPVFTGTDLIAIKKSVDSEDVRPIGMGGVLRKIAAKLAFDYTQSSGFNSNEFSKVQYSLVPSGIEQIVHSFQIGLEKHPELDRLAIDASNAFNASNRLRALYRIMKTCPAVYPLMRSMYFREGIGWYYGVHEGISEVLSSDGFVQGDAMATWAFNMCINPLIKGIVALIKDEFGDDTLHFVKFYVDDGTIAAPHHIMLRIIEYITTEGPKFGFNMNKSKGCYMVGLCATNDESIARITALKDIGISEDIIVAHPDNCLVLEDGKLKYGMKLLGSFVGSKEFIFSSLRKKVVELKIVTKQLMKYPDLQGRMLLFTKCFQAKPNYLFRTLPPDVTAEFAFSVKSMQHQILCSIIGCKSLELSEEAYSLACFRVQDGGLGLLLPEEVRHAAYTASFLAFCSSDAGIEINAQEILESSLISGRGWNRNDIHHVGQVCKAMLLIELGPPLNREAKLQLLQEFQSLRYSNELGTVQSQLTCRLSARRKFSIKNNLNNTKLAWLVNLENDTAGAWLVTTPVYKNLAMPREEFRTALRHRLFLPIQGLPLGCVCGCNRNPRVRVDPTCHHFATGCALQGKRTHTHNAVAACLDDICHHAGRQTIREDWGCFRALGPHIGERPDLSITNPPNSIHRKFLIDVGITNPLEGAQSGNPHGPQSRRSAQVPGQAAKKYFNTKNATYLPLCNQLDFGFLPFILGSSGCIHDKGKSFLRELAQMAEGYHKIPAATLYFYYVKKISVCLQRSLATCINSKIYDVLSRSNHRVDPSFHYFTVIESGVSR